jgi:Phage integrase family
MYIKAPTAKGMCRYVRPYPPDCAKELGKVNFVRTLGTRNIAEANKRQKEIDDLYDKEVYNIRSRARIPAEERYKLVAYLKGCELLPDDVTDIDLVTVQRLLKELKNDDRPDSVAPRLDTITAPYKPMAWKRLHDAERAFLGEMNIPDLLDVHKTIYRVPNGNYTLQQVVDKVVDSIEKIYTPPTDANGKPSTYKLRHVYEKWEEKIKPQQHQKYRVSKAYTLLKDWCGDKPINSYKKEEITELLEAYQNTPAKLPPEIAKLPSFKNQYDAVMVRNIVGETRAGQTIQNIKDGMSLLFQFAIDRLGVEMTNPIKNIRIDTRKGRKKRVRYGDEDLQKIFYSPLYKGFESPRLRYKKGSVLVRDAKFWLPLIGLYSGARQEEIAQLHLTDITESKGAVYLDVNDWDEHKKVKNEDSIRTVPVHHELIKIGFLDYIAKIKESGATRLFPDLTLSPDGRYAKEFSKWYGRVCRKLGIEVKQRERKDFHSFRHNFITAATTVGVPREKRMEIVGHGEGYFGDTSDVHGDYMDLEPHTLNEELQKVKYDALDLSFLYVRPQKKPLPIKPCPIKKTIAPDAGESGKQKTYKLKVRRPKMQPA